MDALGPNRAEVRAFIPLSEVTVRQIGGVAQLGAAGEIEPNIPPIDVSDLTFEQLQQMGVPANLAHHLLERSRDEEAVAGWNSAL